MSETTDQPDRSDDSAQAIVTEHPPTIQHGDRRSVSEIWPRAICGCGRKVRYISVNDESREDSCSKYGRCMSWDELKRKYDELRRVALEFADEPMDRSTYTLDHGKRNALLNELSR